MTSDLLRAIGAQAGQNTANLIIDAEDDINAAIEALAREAEESDGEVKLKLAISHEVNMDGNALVSRLTVNVRHKHEVSGQIPDPNQTMLGIN